MSGDFTIPREIYDWLKNQTAAVTFRPHTVNLDDDKEIFSVGNLDFLFERDETTGQLRLIEKRRHVEEHVVIVENLITHQSCVASDSRIRVQWEVVS